MELNLCSVKHQNFVRLIVLWHMNADQFDVTHPQVKMMNLVYLESSVTRAYAATLGIFEKYGKRDAEDMAELIGLALIVCVLEGAC